MKNAFLLIWLSITHFVVNGQVNFCGTQSDLNYVAHYPALVEAYRGQSSASRATTLYIPVFYHLIGKSNHTATKRLSEVLASHCELNEHFLSAKIQFYIAGIDTLYDDSYYQFTDYFTGDNIMNTYNVSDVCNIYINKNPNGVCGYAYFPNSGPNGGGIFINEGCYGTGTTTLTHEMGHYCGLPHTFDNWGGVEFVNGTNCSNAGDYFCDTPADFLDYRWTCPYTGNQTDPNGDLYKTVLDGTFFMSYANDFCHSRFSTEQRGYMYNTLLNQRSGLITNNFTGFLALDSVVKISPAETDTTVAADNAIFRWNKVAGAKFYLFEIQGTGTPVVDTALTDTILVIKKLTANRVYKYRIMPVGFSNNCNTYNSYSAFKTSSVKLNASITDRYCEDLNEGIIALNPSLGVSPYTYLWSTGDTTKTLSGIAPGTYTVTVADFNGNKANAEFVFNSLPIMQNFFSKNTNKLITNVTGGFPPYTYDWANGGTSYFYSPLVLGQYYSVHVTDSKGCEKDFELIYNSIENVNENELYATIFPNPIHENQLEITLSGLNSKPLNLSITDIHGKLVRTFTLKSNTGEQHVKLGVEELGSGIYAVSIANGDNRIVTRFIIP